METLITFFDVIIFLMFLFFWNSKIFSPPALENQCKSLVYPLWMVKIFSPAARHFFLKPPEYLKFFLLFFKPPEFCSFLLLVEFYLLRVLIFWFKSPEFFRFLFFAEFYLLKVLIFWFKSSEFGRVFLLRGGLIFKSPVR